MSKELEAFRDILGILSAVSGCEVDMDSERIKLVKQALQRLESIDNANPSEALEELEKYIFNEWKQNHVNFGCDYKLEAELNNQLNNLKSIKQALLKAQEQEKVLEILKERHVDILNLEECIEREKMGNVELHKSRR